MEDTTVVPPPQYVPELKITTTREIDRSVAELARMYQASANLSYVSHLLL
jgi:hypothetical protein